MFRVLSGRRLLMLGLTVLMATFFAASMFAQTTTGTVKGKVLNDKGQVVEQAKITIESKDSGSNRSYTVMTNRKGEFVQIGLAPGAYRVTADKQGVGTQTFDVQVKLANPVEMKFQLGVASSGPSKEEIEKRNKIKTLFDAGVAAHTAGDADGAIAKFGEAIALFPECYDCYYNLGLAQAQKKDYGKAEEAYKKAIELKADYGTAYEGLANIYNAQKRFEEASAASQKAVEFSGAAASGGGGGNVSALYNQGVISWNANKFDDAKSKFEEAIKVDPNHADSHYQLGMCLVNLGKLPEAAAEFETYLKLAPTGSFAAQAQNMVKALKK